ncbi:MAG TPA: hypothetical protein VEL49_06805 [Ktedonobacteraceae bacterium]|nr:hypothetical protein [Ktedonobacteraceae bacterium]
MLSNDMNYLAHRERYEALLKEAAQQRFVRASKLQQTSNTGIATIHWIGLQMVKWGCILHHRSTTTSCCTQATS